MLKIENIAEDQILFYDLETDDKFAPYAKIRMIGCQYGFEGERETVRTYAERKRFREAMASPWVLKVGFNNCNYDDLILRREGIGIDETSRHDVYLMIKAIHPRMPSYSLKYLMWHIFGDHHWPEYELERHAKKHAINKWTESPDKLLKLYQGHDLQQHCQLFCYAWEIVQRKEHWSAYCLDLSNGAPLEEMVNEGGVFVNPEHCKRKIVTLQNHKRKITEYAKRESNGAVLNPNSSKQLGKYFDTEGFELELSANGDFAVRKADLIRIKPDSRVARASLAVRRINSDLKYYENYLEAANYEIESPRKTSETCRSLSNVLIKIPVSYSISNARTRRYTSSSKFGINFQNADEHAKSIWHIPEGWLGWWIDSTQIENVVHIYESEDDERRSAYESDPDWNEYVWLCNRIIGGTPRNKKELDSIPSPQMPNWSVYKQFKTCKLALNFGMGVSKFCRTTGVESKVGKKTFELVHQACPAILKLQDKVRDKLIKYGYVTDVFGHRYIDSARRAYKCVAYLVQGCGTGSLPKAQIRANYETLKSFGSHSPDGISGYMCTTTHDDNGGRINLRMPQSSIVDLLGRLMYNMTKKFSYKFDSIPLRAKLYLSTTTAAEAQEVDLTKPETYERYLS